MNIITLPFILLVLSTLLIIFLAIYLLGKRPFMQLQKTFLCVLSCVFIICVGVLLQNIFSSFININPLYFEYFIYIGTCFLPVAIFFMALSFKETKIKYKMKYLLLFIIPVLSLIILWTNDIHHLFFLNYSLSMYNTVVGFYFYIHSIYTYALLFISMIMLLQTSFKTSGFFSKQSILLMIGTIIPIIINLLGTAKILNMNVFLTPICFSITIIFYCFAIFRFNFLDISPIALQRIVDVMSDSYLVLDTQESIIDYNSTFIKTFYLENQNIRKQKVSKLLNSSSDFKTFSKAFKKSIDEKTTVSLEYYVSNIKKYFNVEISPLYNNKVFIGSLILFKDITQHIIDMQNIKDKQETLMEKERLASLGQLIGGIAHNLKTPIMSISGATEGLSDLIKEYDSSIGDPEVNQNDHHDIAKDMTKWVYKIRNYTEYMSDIITAVKGQAVALSNENDVTFTVGELLKRVNILMKHELKNSIIYLNISMKTDENIIINGDVNSLVQVINNMISNSIQAYNGKPEQNIDLVVIREKNDLIISITDYASGIPKKVLDKLFKEMITTKGKNGTGLGLYMSFSTIKAHFNGNITVQSQENVGTTFNIILPI